MNQFLQIMNEDTENSQFDVDIFCCLFLVGGMFYDILLHVILFFYKNFYKNTSSFLFFI